MPINVFSNLRDAEFCICFPFQTKKLKLVIEIDLETANNLNSLPTEGAIIQLLLLISMLFNRSILKASEIAVLIISIPGRLHASSRES